MTPDAAHYKALTARDPRFDGVFYVGVTSTGIYCRPICPARTPMQKNCRFFTHAEAAEKAAFRPCLRCRPELAPGLAPVDDAGRIASLIATRLQEGLIDNDGGLEDIAQQFDLSSRQIRRVMQKELGVSPIEFLQTRRLLLAKQLLTETKAPITDVAFASGFSSLRRFNAAFAKHYGMAPNKLRKHARSNHAVTAENDSFELQLSYRAPYDWEGILNFLRNRTLKGVEHVDASSYSRTVDVNGHKGWLQVRHAPEKHAIIVRFAPRLMPVLPVLLARMRNLFDLSARPDIIATHLGKDKILTRALKKIPVFACRVRSMDLNLAFAPFWASR